VEEIFGAIGRVTMVEEPMLDAVTGLSGSGPGFIAALAHSMIEGGVRSGLPRDVAYKLALQTMKGTAELLLIDGLEPMQLFRMVATPHGTTEAWSAGCGGGHAQGRGDRHVLRRTRRRGRRLRARLRWWLQSRGISSVTSILCRGVAE